MTRTYLLLFFILLESQLCFGQTILSIDECRNLAIKNNKELKVASEEVQAAYYNKREAFYHYLPNPSLVGTYVRSGKNIEIIPSSVTMPNVSLPGVQLPPPGTEIPVPEELRNLIGVNTRDIWAGGIVITQPLFMGGKIIAYNDIQKYAEQLAIAKKDTKLSDVIVETDNAYWQVVSLANKKKLADSYVDLLKKMESDIIEMEYEGVVTKADRLSVSVKLNEAEMTQTKVQNGLSLSKMLLAQICGLDITDNLTLADEALLDLNVQGESPEFGNVEEALVSRPEIKSLDLAAQIYKKKEKVVLSEFLPNVALMGSYLATNPSAFNGFRNKMDGTWYVGVLVNVPLNFWTSSAKLNAAKANTRSIQFQLDEVKEKIELQVHQSIYKLNEANKKYTLAMKNMEKSDENLRYATVGFEEGVIPASDVLAAHTAWASAHSEYIDAQIDLKLCRIYLNKALGRTLN